MNKKLIALIIAIVVIAIVAGIVYLVSSNDLNKNVRYYNRTDAQLEQFKNWDPGFDNQK